MTVEERRKYATWAILILWGAIMAQVGGAIRGALAQDYTMGGTVVIDSPAVDSITIPYSEIVPVLPWKRLEVEWRGHPVVALASKLANEDVFIVIEDAELGLREDGVVVWRESE